MRFLFLTPQLPYPPQQGAAMRNWGLIRELATRHEVHLLCFAEERVREVPALASVTTVPTPTRNSLDRLKAVLTSRDPDMAHRLASDRFAGELARILNCLAFDVVQVEGIELLPYALPYLGRQNGPLWVYDAHNAEADLQRSAMRADLRVPGRWHAGLYSVVQYLKLARYEQRYLPRFDLVVAVSEVDAGLLQAATGVRPLVIPNGIDTELFSPEGAAPAPAMQAHDGPSLLFSGKMDFRPNVDGVLWFVDEILPKIPHNGTPPTLWVVGQKPHSALARLRSHPQVVLTGWVEAMEPYVAGADLVVVPLRMGSGTRLKVLQALSMARPVVGTPLGCAGLGLDDGEQVRLADRPEAFAVAVGELLLDPACGARMGRMGRRHVQASFDWKVLVPRLEGELVARRASTSTASESDG